MKIDSGVNALKKATSSSLKEAEILFVSKTENAINESFYLQAEYQLLIKAAKRIWLAQAALFALLLLEKAANNEKTFFNCSEGVAKIKFRHCI